MGETGKVTLAFFMAAANVVTAGPGAAENYPTKPIRFIVPSLI